MRVVTAIVYGPRASDVLPAARAGEKLLALAGLEVVHLQAEGPWQLPGIGSPIVFGAGGVPAAPVASVGTCYAQTTGGAKLAPVEGSLLRLVLEVEAVRVVEDDGAEHGGAISFDVEGEVVEDDGIADGEPRY